MTVYLVGAGPGDPGLVTVRGADLLSRADAVVYDRLSARELLDAVPAGAERISVGKRGGGASVSQEQINEILIDLGRRFEVVVRLKGGDPFLFARGGEEVAALMSAGVAVQVVPGVSSAFAAPAYAGVPVTQRFSSTSVTVVTGHVDPAEGNRPVAWEEIARVGGTIVVLMGVANWPAISAALMRGGLAPTTPAMAVTWGTRASQRVLRSTLAELDSDHVRAPATFVVGEVAGLDLDWATTQPLWGRRIVLTRTRRRAGKLTDRLRDLGAEVVSVPTIRTGQPSDRGRFTAALESLDQYSWVLFTSPNGVESTFDELARIGRDARAFAASRIGAVGPGTKAALEARGLLPDLLPKVSLGTALAEALPTPDVPIPDMHTGQSRPSAASGALDRRVLLLRAETANREVLDVLRAKGWDVTDVAAYRTEVERYDTTPEGLARADTVIFSSGSTVSNFVASLGVEATPPTVISIGPLTTGVARDLGVAVTHEADPHTIDGLVDAVLRSTRPAEG